jgi:hypothetical protein
MKAMRQQKVEYEKLASGYESAPASFHIDKERVKAFLEAVDDRNRIYEECKIVPPMVVILAPDSKRRHARETR